MKPANPRITELKFALADAKRRTRDDIIDAIDIAYEAGRLDGKIEACEAALKRPEPPRPAP